MIEEIGIAEIDGLFASLDNAAIEAHLARPYRVQKNSYASGAYKCGLAQWYARTGVAPTDATYNPDTEIAARLGDTLHAILQERLILAGHCLYVPAFARDGLAKQYQNKDGLQPVVEMSLAPETLTKEAWQRVQKIGISCRIDCGISINEQPVYLEIKTKSVKDFHPHNKRYFDEFLADTELQVQYALELFDTPTFGKFKYALVLVVSRDVSETTHKPFRRLFLVEPNQTLALNEIERVEAITRAVEAKEQPLPEPHRGKCKFGAKIGCSYYSICPASEKQKSGR